MSHPQGKKARVIAFYLPQYHPTAINDAWWGKGFTEWTNVGKAKPLFKGHYQPRVPADLGYYDLRLPEIREAQAEMARNAGIEGFMYWNYWFGNGVRALEMPLQELLRTGKPDFPFCVGWGNHTWNNHDWNANAKFINKNIIEQTYPGKEDYTNHFYSLLDAFKDERYIKVDNKPFFLIYSPLHIPDARQFIDTWQDLAVKNGLEGIYFVGRAGADYKNLLDMGFDAINTNGQWRAEAIVKGKYIRAIQNRLNKLTGGVKLDLYDYEKIIKHVFTPDDRIENIFPTIFPQWDRSPRSGRKAVIYKNSTPKLFKEHVREAVNLVDKKSPEHKIVLLKSWNEWAEGNYMEPDLVFGHGFLNALRDELLNS
jgi:hypothetical protein